ncbi:cell wall-binding protein [Clostridium sp.]|uniref:cell wall-binding protein n=1 Tax=Clostridium sp. TaxID=1506 RepID=UPI0025BCE0B8|nr:cell wall-binding protein [Clostridium sp.]
MKNNKLRILALTILVVLAQGTCTYAASSDKDTYTKDELNNLTPGFESTDIAKSNYNVNSYTNSFSSAQTKDIKTDTKITSTTTANNTSDSSVGNVIVSTAPSTGINGDFWGKTSAGKWLLLEQGVPVSGWKIIRGKWYYMDADGVMQTGWINYNESWYYLNSGGDMAYDTYIDGYYLDWSGAMQ